MIICPIAAIILVQTTLKLGVVQELSDMTDLLKKSIQQTNSTNNKPLVNSIKVLESSIDDIHTDICTIVSTRERRQAMIALGSGLVAAMTTLIVTSGRLLNYLSPHGDNVNIDQHQVGQPDLQLLLEKEDRSNIQGLADRLYMVEEIERLKLVAEHFRTLTSQFLKPDNQSPIARKIKARTAQIYFNKFTRMPPTDLDYSKIMSHTTHLSHLNTTKDCLTSNLTLTFETSYPDERIKLSLTSADTATDERKEKCLLLTGTIRINDKLVMAKYPVLELEKNSSLCSPDSKSCHTILIPTKPCLAPKSIHIENDRITIFKNTVVQVTCKKSSLNEVKSAIGITFLPIPQCTYRIAMDNLLIKINRIPTFTKSLLETQVHINESFVLHDAAVNWNIDPQDLLKEAPTTSSAHSTTNTLIILALAIIITCAGLTGLYFKCKATKKTPINPNSPMVNIEMATRGEASPAQPLMSRSTSMTSSLTPKTSTSASTSASPPAKVFDPYD